jgi:hypothetical protein
MNHLRYNIKERATNQTIINTFKSLKTELEKLCEQRKFILIDKIMINNIFFVLNQAIK